MLSHNIRTVYHHYYVSSSPDRVSVFLKRLGAFPYEGVRNTYAIGGYLKVNTAVYFAVPNPTQETSWRTIIEIAKVCLATISDLFSGTYLTSGLHDDLHV